MLSCVFCVATCSPLFSGGNRKNLFLQFLHHGTRKTNMATRTKPAAAVVLGDIILLSTPPPPEIECMTTCLSLPPCAVSTGEAVPCRVVSKWKRKIKHLGQCRVHLEGVDIFTGHLHRGSYGYSFSPRNVTIPTIKETTMLVCLISHLIHIPHLMRMPVAC